LEYVQGKNKDLREVTLKNSEGGPLLKFAQAYGFRNIQNIMRKIKQGKCDYDYVEIMACPNGCVNGGGQVKLKDTQKEGLETNQDLVHQVQSLLHQQSPIERANIDSDRI
jgi:iron only hydrogenase large subunit-like protein